MLPAGHSGAPGLNAATLYTVIRAACTSRCIFAMIFAGEMLAILFLDAKKKARSIYGSWGRSKGPPPPLHPSGAAHCSCDPGGGVQ